MYLSMTRTYKRYKEEAKQNMILWCGVGVCRERNEAVSQLGEGMRQLERLEGERNEMIARMELINRDQDTRQGTLPHTHTASPWTGPL